MKQERNTEALKPCPFCGGTPQLVDNRMEWFVRCDQCRPFKTVIYGENVRHLDHEEDADLGAVDWDALRQTAIDAWNRRAAPALQYFLQAAEMAAIKEVLRISDRKHDAWDAAKAAIARVESRE